MPSNVTVLKCRSLLYLFTKIPTKDTEPAEFASTARRLMRIISEVLDEIVFICYTVIYVTIFGGSCDAKPISR